MKDDTEIEEELSLFFSNVFKSLNFADSTYITNKVSDNMIYPIDRALGKFKTHASVLIIKDNIFKKMNFQLLTFFNLK